MTSPSICVIGDFAWDVLIRTNTELLRGGDTFGEVMLTPGGSAVGPLITSVPAKTFSGPAKEFVPASTKVPLPSLPSAKPPETFATVRVLAATVTVESALICTDAAL